MEHHLHRGRALAAFNHILGVRASKLKSAQVHMELSGQANIQTDMQAILAPLTQSEGSLLSSVRFFLLLLSVVSLMCSFIPQFTLF